MTNSVGTVAKNCSTTIGSDVTKEIQHYRFGTCKIRKRKTTGKKSKLTPLDEIQTNLSSYIDSKAKVKIGNLSRAGKARTIEPLEANDHDSEWFEVLVPFGILDIQGEKLSIYFGTSAETSDFIVDCLENWYRLTE